MALLQHFRFPILGLAAVLPFLPASLTHKLPNLPWQVWATPPSLAQAVPPTLPTQQGNQITLNGKTLSGFWYQQQGQIGIADTALNQLLGVDFLNTAEATRQPVQWFSNATETPIVLSAWLINGYRYLDITNLARQFGWQIQPIGNVLNIQTSPASVLAVRQGRQTWGDRIVIDLDRPTPWQISQQNNAAAITVNANINPELAKNFTAGPGNLLRSLRVQSQAGQTQIQIQVPDGIRPRIWTLPNPNRLVIDVRPDSLPERNIAWAPGVQWQQRLVNVGNARFPVVMLVVDPRHPNVSLKPIRTDISTAVGISPLITMAQRWQAIAAINGGFFNRNNQLPLGVVRRDRQWFSGPILNRGAIAWDDAGNVEVGRLSLSEEIVTASGQRFPVLTLNSGYVQTGIARYTPDWGGTYTPVADNEILVSVQGDRVIDVRNGGSASQISQPIPAGGYLLTLRGNGANAALFPVGTTIQLKTATIPNSFEQYPQIMGAGPLLVQNRRIVLDATSEQFSEAFIRQAAPRSAIGVLPDGRLALVAIHDRIGGRGPTLGETAQLMQQLGVIDALNLDGGSSTSLYLGGQLLDRPPQTAARVQNAIGVFVQPSP